MATSYGKLSPGRRRTLAAVMLGTLGLMVLAAFALQLPASGRVDEAENVLADARRASADQLWPAEPVIDWYYQYGDGRVVGWKAIVRGRGSDGRFLGARLSIRSGQAPLMERWSLNQKLTAGDYVSHGSIQGHPIDMEIKLRDGMVTTNGAVPRPAGGTAKAPRNYLPEGTLELIARRMADKAGTDAQFQLIYDALQRPGGVVFTTLRFHGLGEGQRRDGTPVLRTQVTGAVGRRAAIRVLEFDRHGTLVRDGYASIGAWFERVSEEEVLRISPNAPQVLVDQLLRLHPGPEWTPLLRHLERLLSQGAGAA